MKDRNSLNLLGGNAEYYETLRNNLILPLNGSKDVPHLIMATSYKDGEGVSTIAANLAITLAHYTNNRVLLVDTNIQKPYAQKKFKVNLAPGLGEILMNTRDNESAIKPSRLSNLFILTAGEEQYDLTPKLDSLIFTELLHTWKHNYQFIVFDSPSLQCAGNFSVRLASIVDGVILVIEAESIRREVAQRWNERLVQSRAKILGVVLNKRKLYVPRWLYKTL